MKKKKSTRGRFSPTSARIRDAVTYYLSLTERPYGTQKQVCARFRISPSSLATALKRNSTNA